MEVAQKIMIACLLMSEGADDASVKEFLSVIEHGISLQEKDSIDVFAALMARMDGDLPAGSAGEIIRLMKAKLQLDDTCKKFGLALSGLGKVVKILDAKPQNDFAAKVMMRRALDVIDEAKQGLV